MSYSAPGGTKLEGSFSSYALITDVTLAGTSGKGETLIGVGTDGSMHGIDSAKLYTIADINGTVKAQITLARVSLQPQVRQSLLGTYKILFNASTNKVLVYKNNVLLQTIDPKFGTKFISNAVFDIGISSDGKYIVLYGDDFSNVIDRLQVWQGS